MKFIEVSQLNSKGEPVNKFSTAGECREYIKQHKLDTIPMPVYSEDDGELLYFTVYSI